MQKLPAWSRWCLDSPKWVITLFIMICVIAGIGAKDLYFRGDYKVFFEDDDPQKVAYEEMQNVFNKSENVSFLIIPASGSVYDADTFSLIQALTEDAWQVPMSTRVESLSNYQYTYSEQEDLIVTDLIMEGQTSATHINWVHGIVDSIQNLKGRLVSRDGRMAVINVTIQLPDGDQTPNIMKIADFARQLEEKYEQAYPKHRIYLSGVVIMNDAFALSAQKDATTLIPAMFVIIVVMIAWLTRSVPAALATLAIVGGSIIVTMGLAGYSGIFLSPSTVNVPTMVMTLAVADCIHLIVSYRQQLQKGVEKRQALENSLLLNFNAIVITSVTTAIGFLTLNFAAVPILSDLGNLAALGVGLACIFALAVLPAILMLAPVRGMSKGQQGHGHYGRLGDWVVNHYRKILPMAIIVMGTSLYFCTGNELNDVAVEYFGDQSEFRQTVKIQEAYMGGMSNIDFVIYTDEVYGINNPDVMQKVDALSTWLREQKEVQHVLSFSDIIKRLNMNMNNDDPDAFVLPESQDQAAQYLLLYEMSLPYGLDLNNQIDIDKSAVRITAVLANLGSNELTEFERRAKSKFEEMAPDLRIEAASPPLMFAHIGARNMKSMVWGSLVALILISLLIMVTLRSWRLGFVSLFANIMPAAVGFGIWGLLSGEINMALSVELSMTMGIIVDDTVHFLLKYQNSRRQGQAVSAAVRYAFKTVGQAMVTTTLVLAAGFGILMLSDFRLNSDMGLMTNIIFIAALIIDLLFLPAFLLWLDRDKNTKTRYAS